MWEDGWEYKCELCGRYPYQGLRELNGLGVCKHGCDKNPGVCENPICDVDEVGRDCPACTVERSRVIAGLEPERGDVWLWLQRQTEEA